MDASPSKKKSKSPAIHRKQLLSGVILSFLSVVVLLGSIELAGFLWERKAAQDSLGWTLVASRRMPLVRHGAGESAYYLLESNSEYVWEGIPVHIGQHGFRNEEFSIAKPAGAYRILNVGDSVVFGWEVLQEESYGKLLERMLNELENGRHYEVINAGVPGWDLSMARDFLRQEGLAYEPDMVLLDITLVNDVYGTGPNVSEQPDLFEWLRDHTYGWPFLTIQGRLLLSKKAGPQAIPALTPPSAERNYYPLNENHAAWTALWNNVLEIQQMTEERDIGFALVIFPMAPQLNSAGYSDFPQRLVSERATAAQIEFVDLLPVYQQVCETSGDGACEGFENILFADVWMHPSVLGHRLAAQELFKLFDQ